MLYSVELRSHSVYRTAKIDILCKRTSSFGKKFRTLGAMLFYRYFGQSVDQVMHIEIWSVGRENDKYVEEGIQYYFQKTKPYNTVELVLLQLPRKLATTDADRAKALEEEMILKRLQPQHYMILLDERGKQLTSPQWATQFQQLMNQGTKTLVLLIGGAFGVTDTVRKQAKQVWSLSPLVFPHQLVRLILAEQVYRAFSILNNSPYHHS
jgi:23S rRNA (pseudouridine1915-N3)-methyltransferase